MDPVKLSMDEITRRLELLSRPVDFDQLCAEGVLERIGKSRFKVLDIGRLPEHVRLRIKTLGPDGVEFEDTVEVARRRLERLKRGRQASDKPAPSMERFFDPLDDPKCRERQYAAYRSNPEWHRIYSFLRRGYWHVTNPKAWKAIRASKAIGPNLDGRYETRWDPTVASQCYATVHKCISLFDFVSPSEEEVIQVWGNAWDVLTDLKKATVLLRLDRRRLKSRIIPNREAWKREDKKVFGNIPYCEVWYPGEIPMVAVIEVYVVPPPSRSGEFNPIRLNEPAS